MFQHNNNTGIPRFRSCSKTGTSLDSTHSSCVDYRYLPFLVCRCLVCQLDLELWLHVELLFLLFLVLYFSGAKSKFHLASLSILSARISSLTCSHLIEVWLDLLESFLIQTLLPHSTTFLNFSRRLHYLSSELVSRSSPPFSPIRLLFISLLLPSTYSSAGSFFVMLFPSCSDGSSSCLFDILCPPSSVCTPVFLNSTLFCVFFLFSFSFV